MSEGFIRCRQCNAKIELPEFDVAVPNICADCAPKLYPNPAEVTAGASEPPLLSEPSFRAGADHAPSSAAREGSVAPEPVTEDGRAHEIALKSLYWDTNPTLVTATNDLRAAGYNNAKGYLSNHMAGRFLDAYMAAKAAIAALNTETALLSLAREWEGRGDDCGRLARAVVAALSTEARDANAG